LGASSERRSSRYTRARRGCREIEPTRLGAELRSTASWPGSASISGASNRGARGSLGSRQKAASAIETPREGGALPTLPGTTDALPTGFAFLPLPHLALQGSAQPGGRLLLSFHDDRLLGFGGRRCTDRHRVISSHQLVERPDVVRSPA